MSQTANSNAQNGKAGFLPCRLGHFFIAVSDLFRISSFEFRISDANLI